MRCFTSSLLQSWEIYVGIFSYLPPSKITPSNIEEILLYATTMHFTSYCHLQFQIVI